MKTNTHTLRIIVPAILLGLLLTDFKTAFSGVSSGIQLCLNIIVPSLFPFLILTSYLNAAILGHKIPCIQFITRRLQIPVGGESILLLGLIGGYPIGAKLIADLHREKKISTRTAHILLGYCNNAGPAFIFGIAGAAFDSPLISLMLWLIHIISAIVTGFLLPKPDNSQIHIQENTHFTITMAIKNGTSACISICGWVIAFKIIISYLQLWFPDQRNRPLGIIISGILELSNGCTAAVELSSPSDRFIILSVLFAFGGLCVLLQTASVTGSLGRGLYVHGKLIQTCVSYLFAFASSMLLFVEGRLCAATVLFSLLSVIIITFTALNIKNSGKRIKSLV